MLSGDSHIIKSTEGTHSIFNMHPDVQIKSLNKCTDARGAKTAELVNFVGNECTLYREFFFASHTRIQIYINRLANTTIQPTPHVPLCKRHTVKHINNINTLTCVTMHFVVIDCLSRVHTSIHFTLYYISLCLPQILRSFYMQI